ncbi:MAG: hypothetical protein HRU34_23750 [Richelia sp.]|nr:hypothetical protein [Richelia sp.]CDN12196.1 Mobile element protein [Richelia intracellularis]
MLTRKIYFLSKLSLCNYLINFFGVAESGDDFTKYSTIYQWFQTLIHPLIQQRQNFI